MASLSTAFNPWTLHWLITFLKPLRSALEFHSWWELDLAGCWSAGAGHFLLAGGLVVRGTILIPPQQQQILCREEKLQRSWHTCATNWYIRVCLRSKDTFYMFIDHQSKPFASDLFLEQQHRSVNRQKISLQQFWSSINCLSFLSVKIPKIHRTQPLECEYVLVCLCPLW